MDSLSNVLAELTSHSHFPKTIDTAVILGSGLGGFEKHLTHPLSFAYEELEGMPQTTVAGHSGSLHVGSISGANVLVFAGRFHHYEGHDFSTTILPVQLAHALGATSLIVSNAAGGINPHFSIGDLMLIDSFLHTGKWIQPPSSSSLSRYSPNDWWQTAQQFCRTNGIPLQVGNYLYVTGPSYETPAEIRAFRTLGADAVGMSTAPELSLAARLGIKSLGISLITNKATGLSPDKLDHSEIKEAASVRSADFISLVKHLIEQR